MNKLRDWLKRATGGEAPRMGFGAMAPKAKGPTLGLMACLPSLDEHVASGALEAGAEALLVPAGPAKDLEALRAAIQGSERCIWGLELNSRPTPDPDPKFDFYLILPSSGLSILKGEEPGRLLAIDPTWDDVKLRVLDQVGVDGLVFSLPTEGGAPLTVEHLLAVRRLSLVQRKPLILQLDRSLPAEDLETLRDGGLSAILVAANTLPWLDTIKDLKEAIAALPPRGRPRREVDVILPALQGRVAPTTEEEEEENRVQGPGSGVRGLGCRV